MVKLNETIKLDELNMHQDFSIINDRDVIIKLAKQIGYKLKREDAAFLVRYGIFEGRRGINLVFTMESYTYLTRGQEVRRIY